jgi:ribonuclease D
VYISTESELKDLVSSLRGSRVIAIDTEFLREKVYHPQLCLLQLATHEAQFLIDPLAIGDISALAEVFTDPSIVKVFHAGDQDRELIVSACGAPAAPVFDTQIAAAYLGLPSQMGYGALVKSFCTVDLPKTDSMTDWSQRPLTPNQLAYAVDDVLYLPGIYDQMVAQLTELDRFSWLEEELNALSDPVLYQLDYDQLWRKVKRASALTTRQLVCVRVLARWREQQATRRDLPRRWVLSDEMIVDIARRQPKTVEDLYRVRGARDKIKAADAEQIVAEFRSDWEKGPDSWPQRPHRPRISEDVEGSVDLMNTLLHLRAKENRIVASLLGTRDDLEAMASGNFEQLSLLEGWRYDIVGRELGELLEGRIGLKVTAGAVEIVHL